MGSEKIMPESPFPKNNIDPLQDADTSRATLNAEPWTKPNQKLSNIKKEEEESFGRNYCTVNNSRKIIKKQAKKQ